MATITLRPNAAGTNCNIEDEIGAACPNHYQNVDESSADGDTTTVRSGTAAYQTDTYAVDNPTGQRGTINSVTVYNVTRGHPTLAADQVSAYPTCLTYSTVYNGTAVQLTTTYDTYSKVWTVNPNTSNAWTWAEIEILEAGVALRECRNGLGSDSHCTQVYAVVDYDQLSGVVFID